MSNQPEEARGIADDISTVLADARRSQFRLVTYFLEMALAEARRSAGEHPALWHKVP